MTLKSPIAMNLSEPIHFAILMMGIWRIFHITLIFLWFCLPDNPQSPPFHTSKVVSWTVDCRLKSQNLAKFYNIAKNMLSFWEFKHNFAYGVLQIKFITPFYSSRRNFWCMTRGDSSHFNFQLQKVDWGTSGRQNWMKTMEFWKILYIHFIRDPKGITYVGLFLQIECNAKMTWSTRVPSDLLRQFI